MEYISSKGKQNEEEGKHWGRRTKEKIEKLSKLLPSIKCSFMLVCPIVCLLVYSGLLKGCHSSLL